MDERPDGREPSFTPDGNTASRRRDAAVAEPTEPDEPDEPDGSDGSDGSAELDTSGELDALDDPAALEEFAEPVEPAEPAPRVALSPVTGAERIRSIDVLRGIAVFGILLVNIYAFAYIAPGYTNPYGAGGGGPLNIGTWIATHVFVEGKFISIFAMLFGAGMWIMSSRADARGSRFGRVYVRRLFWLLVFGAAHGLFIWWGDVLFHYAIGGAVVYRFRKWPARKLFVASAVSFAIGIAMMAAIGAYMSHAQERAAVVAEQLAAGEEPSPDDRVLYDQWEMGRSFHHPTPEEATRRIAMFRGGEVDRVTPFNGGYGGILADRLEFLPANQIGSMTVVLPRVAALMMLGIALLKIGVLDASRSRRFYTRLLVISYAIGFPLVIVGTRLRFSHDFGYAAKLSTDSHFNTVGAIAVALGHIALVMLVVKSGAFGALQRRLAAVGRMALTNYLMQSVIATTLFYGYGLGLFSHLDRFALMGVVVAIWLVELWWSPIWLAWFRFGPAEWLWRTLTYWKVQPMRRRYAEGTAAA